MLPQVIYTKLKNTAQTLSNYGEGVDNGVYINNVDVIIDESITEIQILLMLLN